MVNRQHQYRPSEQAALPVPIREAEPDGACRAARALAELAARGGSGAVRSRPTLRLLQRAVANLNESGTDGSEFYYACRLGASLESLSAVPSFSRVLDNMVQEDTIENAPGFWHDELVLFLACQLRAAGLQLEPLTQEIGKSDPDLHDHNGLYLEVKRRPRFELNDPGNLGSFIRKALRAQQIRDRDPNAIAIIAMDLGEHDGSVHEKHFHEVLVKETIKVLRDSHLVHAVFISALKRGDPATWLYLAEEVPKRKAMTDQAKFALRRVFAYGTVVTRDSEHIFGVAF